MENSYLTVKYKVKKTSTGIQLEQVSQNFDNIFGLKSARRKK
jgi:hypothetical protein